MHLPVEIQFYNRRRFSLLKRRITAGYRLVPCVSPPPSPPKQGEEGTVEPPEASASHGNTERHLCTTSHSTCVWCFLKAGVNEAFPLLKPRGQFTHTHTHTHPISFPEPGFSVTHRSTKHFSLIYKLSDKGREWRRRWFYPNDKNVY